MSQKATRKPGIEDKDKKPSDSPVIELKKKAAANAPAANSSSIQEKEKAPEKAADKAKAVDKVQEKADKRVEKNGVDKEKERKTDGKEKNGQPEKEKADKNAKPSAANGRPAAAASPTANGNGTAAIAIDVVTVSDSEDDELFPELTYDESDAEPPTPDGGRSFTRRSQVKASRTPETPQPATVKATPAEKQADAAAPADESKDSSSKVLQLKDGVPANTDRKLRSADSPKPEGKKDTTKKAETPKKDKGQDVNGALEVEVVVEVENDEEPRKTDTNYSKSRVKVSPYRRSGRLADQTASSIQANYTGNNTTMEMDITESSFASNEPPTEAEGEASPYLASIRAMRGRRSYKLLKDIQITHTNRTLRSANTSTSDSAVRPTAPVVGRKRKPEAEAEGEVEPAAEAGESPPAVVLPKRMRLLDRIAQPFRRTVHSQALHHHAAEIVGINTDLPLTAPVAAPSFDPETLKISATTPPPSPADRDGKRCVVM